MKNNNIKDRVVNVLDRAILVSGGTWLVSMGSVLTSVFADDRPGYLDSAAHIGGISLVVCGAALVVRAAIRGR